jgi:hypothetical protein
LNWIYLETSFGGAEEDRTPDPLRARQVLSQLSYDPFFLRYNFSVKLPMKLNLQKFISGQIALTMPDCCSYPASDKFSFLS